MAEEIEKIDEFHIKVTTTIEKVVSKEELLERLEHVNNAITGYTAEKLNIEEKLSIL